MELIRLGFVIVLCLFPHHLLVLVFGVGVAVGVAVGQCFSILIAWAFLISMETKLRLSSPS